MGYSKNNRGPMLKRQWIDSRLKYFSGSQTPSPNITFFNKLNLSEHFLQPWGDQEKVSVLHSLSPSHKNVYLLFLLTHHNTVNVFYFAFFTSWSPWAGFTVNLLYIDWVSKLPLFNFIDLLQPDDVGVSMISMHQITELTFVRHEE